MDNISAIYFTFTALHETDRTSRIIISTFSLAGFCVTVLLNSTLILIVVVHKALHEPMYIFLCNLCINGLLGSAGFYPKLLSDLILETTTVSVQGCIVQSFVIFIYGIGEFTNLSVMAIDRYLAICKPLNYHNIMTCGAVAKYLTFIWMFPFCTTLVLIIMEARSQMCRHTVDKLYCGNFILERLACSASIFQEVIKWFFFLCLNVLISLVIFSYAKLIIACKRSKLNQKKFMSTCLPHFVAFANFFTLSLLDATHTQFNIYVPQTIQNFNAALVLVIPPFVNPIIYGIKLSPIRAQALICFQKLCFKSVQINKK